MGTYAIKTALGYKEAGENDAQFYISTVEEHTKILSQIVDIKSERDRVVCDLQAEIERVKTLSDRKAEERVSAATLKAQKQVDSSQQVITALRQTITDLQAEKAALQKQLETANNLNINLKRIARERANADRHIIPKKRHDGYLVLSSRQWTEHYTVAVPETGYENRSKEWLIKNRRLRTVRRSVQTWRSIIQSPYESSLPLDNVMDLINNDMRQGHILEDLGCGRISDTVEDGKYRDFGKNEDGNAICGMYRWKFIDNFSRGYWEVEIFTTGPLSVPEDRRIRHKRK